jgi:hypothetical protein
MRKNLFLTSDKDEAIAALAMIYDNSRPNERKISRSGKISMQIGLILEQLDEMRRLDANRCKFGASDHRYALAPPVEPELLRLVETTLGSTLPADYRRFLTALGDGGAGPYYGILSLEESIIRLAPAWKEPSEVGVRELIPALPAFTRDFPLESDVDFGEIIGQPANWEEHVARLERDLEYYAQWYKLQDQYVNEPYDGGWIPICDFGCGDFFTLVLRGKRRGTIWVNSLDSATGFYCLEVGFEQFYRRWLDHALRRLREPDFVDVNAEYSYLKFGDNPRYRPI